MFTAIAAIPAAHADALSRGTAAYYRGDYMSPNEIAAGQRLALYWVRPAYR